MGMDRNNGHWEGIKEWALGIGRALGQWTETIGIRREIGGRGGWNPLILNAMGGKYLQ